MVAFTTEFASPRKSCSPKTPIRDQVQLPGLRYYSPELGRWVNRDPIGERGGVNLLAFTENRPVDRLDRLGLAVLKREKGTLTTRMCGAFGSFEDFSVDKMGDDSGWIVQHTVVKIKITCMGQGHVDANTEARSCSCCEDVENPEWVVVRDFYEAFRFENGGRAARDASGEKEHYCSEGEVKLEKTAVWMGEMSEGKNGCPQGFHDGPVAGRDPTGTGGTCWQDDAPPLWGVYAKQPSLTIAFGYLSKWECCPGENESTVSRTAK